jgi:hypothetical protein
MYLSKCLLLSLLLTVPQSGPFDTAKLCDEDKANICSGIPDEMKVRLMERFNQYVEAHQTKNREKIYDLKYEPPISKKEFLEAPLSFEWSFPKMKAFEFHIYKTFETKAKVKAYSISLCVVNAKASKVTLYQSSAFLMNNEWFFDPITPIGFLEGAKPIPCKLSKKK